MVFEVTGIIRSYFRGWAPKMVQQVGWLDQVSDRVRSNPNSLDLQCVMRANYRLYTL